MLFRFHRGAENKSRVLMDSMGKAISFNSSVSKPVLRCLSSSTTEANRYFVKMIWVLNATVDSSFIPQSLWMERTHSPITIISQCSQWKFSVSQSVTFPLKSKFLLDGIHIICVFLLLFFNPNTSSYSIRLQHWNTLFEINIF